MHKIICSKKTSFIFFILFSFIFTSSIAQGATYETSITGINNLLDKVDTTEVKELWHDIMYDFTDDEIKMLQRITEAECTGQTIESKKNVVSVIINRVYSDSFPNTVKKVIFQDGQFSPVSNGSYWDVEITEDTVKAVKEVLEKGVTSTALYFCNKERMSHSKSNWFDDNLHYLFTDDAGHSFYEE